MSARIQFIYYLDVVSSWCFYAEPMIAILKKRYAGEVEFSWKIALLDESGIPTSREQEDWFYRRSGLMVRWPYMLNSGWYELGLKEYLAPNLVAEAAKEFGILDDRARLALARAAMVDGEKVGRLDVSVNIAANAVGINVDELAKVAGSPEIEKRVRASTEEFHALKVSQRPAFVLQSDIGDRAVFSGLINEQPLFTTIDAMLDDSLGYQTHKAHFGDPPK
jgi:predicted DsbA family dithiol-disulfide isomerase